MITLEIIEGPRPDCTEDGWEHRAYTVRLKRGTLGVDYREMDTPWMQGLGITEDPRAEDVLASLMLDASGYVNARGFEDWAEDCGYDTDSRKAEKLYQRIAREAEAFIAFMGEDWDESSTEDAEDAAYRLVNT